MTVLKQYDSGSSQWVPIVSGVAGATGPTGVTGATGPTGVTGPTTTSPTGSVIAFAGSSAPTDWLLCFGQAVSRTTYASLFAIVSTTYGAGDGTTTFNLPDLRGRTVAGIDNMGGIDAGRLDIANSSGTVVGTQYVTLTSAQSGVPAHSHANTLSSNTVASSSHRHEFGFSLLDNAYAATGTVAGMGSAGMAGAYRYSTGQWQGGVANGTLTDTRRDATSVSTGQSARMSSFGDTETPSANTTVGISNANNTATDASQAHNNMQPTMVLNYIIKS